MNEGNKKEADNADDGFESDPDRIEQEEIEFSRPASQMGEEEEEKEVKEKLPPPQQIRQQKYSLEPDMSTGWSAKIQLPKPIPIINTNHELDFFISKTIKENNKKGKLVYLGPRYPTTFQAWHGKQFANPYTHIPTPQNLKLTTRPFHGKRRDANDCLEFDADIESGNLDAAYRIGPKSYELFLRVDSNTRGHIQWFNFKVKNMEKNQKYTFHICNFQKKHSLYSRGAKPYIFSEKKFEAEGKSWEQTGQNIKYQERIPKLQKIYKYELDYMYTLTFDYSCEYAGDTVQLAYSIPYTYTKLSEFLHRLLQSQKRSYLKMSKLCSTLGGLEVPLIIINQTEGKKDKIDKMFTKCVIVSGRAHPGESNGSYVMEGFLNFLCSSSKVAQNLRKKTIFKIVPMLNPDGVVLGNYRTGLSGKDFNREFLYPDAKIFPEVYAMKKLVTENKEVFKDNLQLFLDFHGHSVKKNVFMYGPEYPIIHRHYYDCRLFPKLLSDHTKMFRFYSCIFKVSEFKYSTARAVLLRKLNIPFSYTIESSNGSYYDNEQLKDIAFNEKSWEHMGQKIAQTLQQYIDLVVKSDKNRYEKLESRKHIKQKPIQYKRSSYQYYNTHKTNKNQYTSDLKKSLSMEDETIINLFAEIQKMQERRQQANEKVSEEELSEGSSDQEGAEDDLDEEKLNYFYDILRKKGSKGQSYDTHEISRFLSEKKQLLRRDSKNTKKIESSAVIQLDKQESKEGSQLLSKIKITERKSFIFRNKSKKKKQQMHEIKQKIHAPKIVSFGTGYIGFDSSNLVQEQKAQKINMEMLSQSIQNKLQTGFLPTKIIDNQKLRQTYVFSKKNRSFDLVELTARQTSLNKMKNSKLKGEIFKSKMMI